MSIFIVDDEVVNPSDLRRTYRFNPDLLAGFKEAVGNNQQMLAIQYLGFIVDVIDSKLSDSPSTEIVEEKKEEVPARRPSRARKEEAVTDESSETA